MQKWEYCEVGSFVQNGQIVDFINYYEAEHKYLAIENINQMITDLGLDGWEMVQVTKDYDRASYAYYFKRALAE